MARPSLRESIPKLRRITSRFAPEIRGERLLIGGALGALLLETCFRLLEPWPIKFVLDRVIVDTPSDGSSGIGFLDRMEPGTLLAVCALAVMVIAALRALALYLSTVGLALAGNRVLTQVRTRLYRHLQRLSLSYHSKARQGDLVTRVTGDIGRLQEVSVTAAMPLLANVFTLVGILAVMAFMNLQLALLALVVMPLFSLSLIRQVPRIRGAARQQRRREGAMAATASESFGAIKVVQAYGLEETIERSFASDNLASLKEGVQTKRLSAGLERGVDVITSVGSALVLFQGARLVQSGSITPGDLVVFLFYLKMAFKPMRDMAKYTARLASAAAAGERVLDVLDSELDIRDSPGALPAPRLRGDVGFESVSLAYEPGRPVLHGIDLRVGAGRKLALVGPSGGGKTSLTNLLLRLYEPSSGRVLLDGHDIRDLTLESVRSQIAVVLQESVLFAVSVRENIAYGAPGASAEEIEQSARLANAHEFIQALPDGYDTVLSERGASLSGGQRQRLAIARAAVRRAPIVLLDEATTGLDEANERTVREALERLTKGRTTIVVAHDLTTVDEADAIAWIEDGLIAEIGTHSELIERGGRYATAYLMQAATRSNGALLEPISTGST